MDLRSDTHILTRADVRRLQVEIRDWIDLGLFRHPHAITLTLKQAVPTGQYGQRAYVTPEAASQNVRHFHNVISRRVIGKAAFLRGDRLPMIGVWESGPEKRLHYHAVIDCVRDEVKPMFPVVVANVWEATRWGYDQVHVSGDATEGWVGYITKLRDKPDFAACLDMGNWHLPTP